MEQLSIQEENEQKKEYLRSYRKALRREERILDEIQELRMNKMFPSAVNDGMPRGSEQSDLSNYIVALDEMIEELKNERLERAKLRQRIERDIRALDNEDEQEVLRLRYIKDLKWEEVALELNYSWAHTHRIHGEALGHFQIGGELDVVLNLTQEEKYEYKNDEGDTTDLNKVNSYTCRINSDYSEIKCEVNDISELNEEQEEMRQKGLQEVIERYDLLFGD